MRPERESTSLYSGAPFSLRRILHPPFERLIGRVDSLQCWSFSVDDEWFCAPQGYRRLQFDSTASSTSRGISLGKSPT